jgi:hypothetical protein
MRSAAATFFVLIALGTSVAAITLAATAVTPFWQAMPFCIAAGILGGFGVLLWRPSGAGVALAAAAGIVVGFVTYLGMVLATLSWWEA